MLVSYIVDITAVPRLARLASMSEIINVKYDNVLASCVGREKQRKM